SLAWMGRGHRFDVVADAMARSRGRGLEICAQVILGLPGESREEMRATARELARLEIASVKIHNLHALKGTRLTQMLEAGEVELPTLKEYVGYAVDFLEELPPTCVIDRISGDAPPQYLVGPAWCRNKQAVRAAIEAELRRRGTRQGCNSKPGGA
ncbi:hypothetical protein LCGC14_2830060, partial [marine sediment metagenome]